MPKMDCQSPTRQAVDSFSSPLLVPTILALTSRHARCTVMEGVSGYLQPTNRNKNDDCLYINNDFQHENPCNKTQQQDTTSVDV